jgi:hypothetical protein
MPGRAPVRLVHSENGHIRPVLENAICHLQGNSLQMRLLGAEYGCCHREKTPFLLRHKAHSANRNVTQSGTITYDCTSHTDSQVEQPGNFISAILKSRVPGLKHYKSMLQLCDLFSLHILNKCDV